MNNFMAIVAAFSDGVRLDREPARRHDTTHRSRLLHSIAAPLLALAMLALSGCAAPPTAVSARSGT